MVRDNKFNFTKERLSKIEFPKQGDKFYMDAQARGLGLRVSYSGSKIFYLCKKISGKMYKRRIGHMDDWSIEEARNKCNELRREIERTTSTDSNQSLVNEITLKELLNKYINDYAVYNNQPCSIEQTKWLIIKYAEPFLDKKLSMITKEEVTSHFHKITSINGIYTANKLIQSLRAIFNKGIEWNLCDKNPCIGIKEHKEKSRDRYIEVEEINIFLKALEEEPNKMVADFFLMCLYTEARKGNVLSMEWENISFENKTWYIPNTKNGEPQNVSLHDIAIKILNRRKENNNTKWVFPSELSASGHLEEPKKVWHRVIKRAGIKNLRIHDLRRTLGSWMANNGATLHVIGGTLGHKSSRSTEIYSRLHINSIRKEMEGAINNMNGNGKKHTSSNLLSNQRENAELKKQNEELKKQIEALHRRNMELREKIMDLEGQIKLTN